MHFPFPSLSCIRAHLFLLPHFGVKSSTVFDMNFFFSLHKKEKSMNFPTNIQTSIRVVPYNFIVCYGFIISFCLTYSLRNRQSINGFQLWTIVTFKRLSFDVHLQIFLVYKCAIMLNNSFCHSYFLNENFIADFVLSRVNTAYLPPFTRSWI